jgi:hypothetical protein
MKTAIVYNLNDHKLLPSAYSQTYRDMFLALVEVLNPQHVTQDCSAEDIEADVIIFFDPHSSHHIKIDGIEKHNAVKYEYMNDPHQKELKGRYLDGTPVHKLGAEARCRRAVERGVADIICPYEYGYYRYLDKYLPHDMLVWFPPVPAKPDIDISLLSERRPKVVGTGHTHSYPDFLCYEFRKWAFRQHETTYTQGCIEGDTPKGKDFIPFLAGFAGALALCDVYHVPKYFEIPLAGCVAFVQDVPDLYKLGFRHMENCVIVNEQTFVPRLRMFMDDVSSYQEIADTGRKLVEDNYTAKHFAKYIQTILKGDSYDFRTGNELNNAGVC